MSDTTMLKISQKDVVNYEIKFFSLCLNYKLI